MVAISGIPLLASLPGIGLAPLVALALALDGAIVGIWYLAGFVLGNSTIRGSAKEEFYQLIGTAVLVGIVIGAMIIFSGIFYSALGATKLMSPAAMTLMCTNLMNGPGINLISGPESILSSSQKPSTFPGLCSYVAKQNTPSLAGQIDYPLAASTVIVANLTNQTIGNLNSTFVYDSFIGFLSQLSPTAAFCAPIPGPLVPVQNGCVNPIATTPPPFLQISYSATPDAGMDMIFNNMVTYGTLLGSAVETLLAQLLVNVVFIYIWPVMLFVGIIFRAVFYTRKIGGLFIAMAIGMVMFFPAVYAFEYLAMANGVPASVGQTYGFSSVTDIPANALSSSTQNYQLNFFVEPNLKVMLQHYQCWPAIAGTANSANQVPTAVPLSEADIYDVAYLTLPALGIIPILQGGLQATPGNVPAFPLPANCGQEAAVNAFLAMVDSYGITGITSFLLPVINLLIVLTGILGLSGQLGGDTSLAGLTKII
ncbi:MAG: hypothetical protein KGH66_02910 [Candidatus Micrarchaeota archaeon]|nr:hypothetical protein [Candidatus Micrarchaeota archaeon]